MMVFSNLVQKSGLEVEQKISLAKTDIFYSKVALSQVEKSCDKKYFSHFRSASNVISFNIYLVSNFFLL